MRTDKVDGGRQKTKGTGQQAGRRRRLVAAVAVGLAFLLLPSSFCLGQELLVNGDFEALDAEGGPENWGLRDWGDSQFAAAKVVGKAAHGERCLELKSRSGPLLFGCFSYPIPLGDQ
ncbi:MAG: hypothetical protein KKI08_19710, partial [Armatimonadetes bacterium]|nr:hypothetical protein [Armatimonadota bacterium]